MDDWLDKMKPDDDYADLMRAQGRCRVCGVKLTPANRKDGNGLDCGRCLRTARRHPVKYKDEETT